jgi:hypothetical protein
VPNDAERIFGRSASVAQKKALILCMDDMKIFDKPIEPPGSRA